MAPEYMSPEAAYGWECGWARGEEALGFAQGEISRLMQRLAEVEHERDFVRSVRPAQRRITELEDELAMCKVANADLTSVVDDLMDRLYYCELRDEPQAW